jgi:GH15 family glucan-1,4-alpha-glucosidase
MSLSDHYFMMVSCSIQEGNTIYFWQDTWNHGVLQWKFLQLYSFAHNKNISTKAIRTWDILDHFWTPLSLEASSQLYELQFLLQQIQVNPNESDKWSYIWNNDEFLTRKAYLQIIGTNNASSIFNWMWKSCSRGKHKFFFWLLLQDHLNTRELLKRKNMDLTNYNCVLCNCNSEKSLFHLFFDCPFSK